MTAQLPLQRLRLPLVGLCALATVCAAIAMPHALADDKPKPVLDSEASIKAKLTPIFEGATKQIGYYSPLQLTLTADKPAGITKEPSYVGKPMYGTLHFGTDAQNSLLIALDMATDGSKATLYVDSDRKGDLTAQAVTMVHTARRMTSPNGAFDGVVFMGTAKVVPTSANGSHTPLALPVYAFGAETAKGLSVPDGTLFYYRDYAQSGKITLMGKEYSVLLINDTASGRYDVTAHGARETPPVGLLIDRNGDGKFDSSYERYDVSRPFNLGGVTYEVAKITPDGSEITLKKSARTALEVPIPANLSAGHAAFAFTRPIIGGKTVKFPADYKGKIVLLDFWATWCGPCVGEIPGLVKTYEKYHSRGFEVLGISLDQAGQEQKVADFLKSHNMTWDQVYDGKAWSAEVAKMYSINSIPRAFLVDGTTGKILVEGEALRGESLDAQISKALATVKVSSR